MRDGKTTGQHRYSSDSKKPRIREASLYLVGLVRLFPFGLSSQAPMWSRCARLKLRSSHLLVLIAKSPAFARLLCIW